MPDHVRHDGVWLFSRRVNNKSVLRFYWIKKAAPGHGAVFLWVCQIECILNEIDFLRTPSGLNCHHIESGILVHLMVAFEIVKGRHGYFSLFMGCYGEPGTPVGQGSPCLHLHKDNRFFIPCDDVDLTHRTLIVQLKDFVAFFFEVTNRLVLTCFPECLALVHFVRYSLTPLKVLR